MFTLTFNDGGMARAHRLRAGETVIGRAPTCDLVIAAPLMSRAHARVRVVGSRVYLCDAGSTYGTLVNGERLTAEKELVSGDTFSVGEVTLTLEREVAEDDLLSEHHQPFNDGSTKLRRVDTLEDGITVSATSAVTLGVTPLPSALPTVTPTGLTPQLPTAERRRGGDRRNLDLGRVAGDRRSGRDRRGGRLLRLLTEIGKTLVTVQPVEQILARVVDLVFETLPAERAFLLLRDGASQPLTARVRRNRDGSVPVNVTLSRTIVNKVIRDRVAMLASDALYDARLDASGSIQAMNIRSFMCAPLWNRSEVIGVLYCDNPRTKKFIAEDLELFAALSNYAAVAIEQGRLSAQVVEETKRREHLQRHHSAAATTRLLQAGLVEQPLSARDLTVLICGIDRFHALCEEREPRAVGELLNEFFERMTAVIFEHEGTLGTSFGEKIMAVFGAPATQPDHAGRAVRAAQALRRELARMNGDRPGAAIRISIAIDSGTALAGDIGAPGRREFTVLGDVVDTVRSLEAVAGPDQILISKHIRDKIGDAVALTPLGALQVTGREAHLEYFDVTG